MSNDEARHDWAQDDPDAISVELTALADAFADDGTEIVIDQDGNVTSGSDRHGDRSPMTFETLTGMPGGDAMADEAWCGDEPDQAASASDDVVEASSTVPVPDGAGMPGGDAVAARVPSGGGVRRQVVPSWVWDRRVVVPWMGGRVLDGVAEVGYHVVRSPWYSLRGLAVIVRGVGGWVTAADEREQFRAEVKAARSLEARRVLRGARVRGVMARGMLASLPVGAAWMWVEFGSWGVVPVTTLAAAYVGLSVAGWRQGRPVSVREKAAVRGKAPTLSRPFVSEALDIVGCGTQKLPGDRVAEPVIQSSSPVRGGELMVIDLPPGVTVARLVKKHEDFAGALGRPGECVVIEPQRNVSPQRFELFIASKLLDEKGSPRWAWGKDVKPRSFFDGVPVGVDARDRPVTVPLFEASGLVAGATGMGKTYSARLVLLGAAMDPRTTLLVHNLKSGPDYLGFAPIAHTLRAGTSNADLDALCADLAWMQSEIARRGAVMAGLPSSQVREGKLTDEVASMPDMGPVVLLIDEPQRAFASKHRGTEVVERLEDVIRTGRAVGFKVQLVTQGTKEGAIPSGILDQCTHRIGHGVTTISDANLVLGSDAHGRSYRPVDIETPGIAYVGTAGGHMDKTAVARVDLDQVEAIVAKVRVLREKAGTLSGMAAGHVEPDRHDGGQAAFLADVVAVWPVDDAGKPWKTCLSATLAGLLVEHDPDEYAGYADEAGAGNGALVSRRLGQAGVKVSSQRTPAGEGRGVKHVDVVQAAGGL